MLALAYDATLDDVRRAFREHARRAHPDRGGSAEAFHTTRAAYDALTADLDGQRRRWQPARPRPTPAGPDARAFPTCPVVVAGRGPDGRPRRTFRHEARPAGWAPGTVAPAGGMRLERVPAAEGRPAYGIWEVPLGDGRVRYVFGPPDA